MIFSHTATFARVTASDSLDLSLERRLILSRANLASRFNEALALRLGALSRCLSHELSSRSSARLHHLLR